MTCYEGISDILLTTINYGLRWGHLSTDNILE